MKKLFPAIAVILLALTLNACSTAVQENNNTPTETTTVQSAPETESVSDVQISETETAPEETKTTSNVTDKETTKPHTTDKVQAKPSTTAKSETTTKKATATTKPQTTSASAPKLPAYSPQPSALALFDEINRYRADNTLNKLALDSSLCKMAYVRAQEQDTLKGHDRPDGSKYYTILDEYNYNYSGCGENISFGKNVTVESTFDRWENSTSHNQNMLESRWTKAGIALHRNIDNSYTIVILFAC